ncbi:MAG TPA: FkbM family methyltransferase [Thermoanaerobaculia bacterium]|nr:FkbM family methyltransferase [Thermoanaerobaculia bacterium]
MTLRDALVTVLNRPGGRTALAAIATLYARRLNRASRGAPLRVLYDGKVGAWGRAQGDRVVIDGSRFRYWTDQLSLAADGTPPWVATARRLWFVDYDPRPGDVILDIGAEVGTDTVAFADAVGPTGRVVAVEAHPVTFRLLQRTVELSGLQDRVICLNAAIADSAGSLVIEDDASTLRSTVRREGEGHVVRALSLDDLCAELGLGEIALLKMNIEGAEREALQGAAATLAKSRHVAVAAHDFRADRGDGESYRTRDFVLKVLSGAGLQTRMAPYDPARDPIADRDHVLARPAAR